MGEIVALSADRDAGAGSLLVVLLVVSAGLIVAGLVVWFKSVDQRALEVDEARF